MKKLVLNGSPKGNRSDTMHITRAFLDAMKDVSQQKTGMIDAALLEEICSPMIPEEQYAAIVNSGV